MKSSESSSKSWLSSSSATTGNEELAPESEGDEDECMAWEEGASSRLRARRGSRGVSRWSRRRRRLDREVWRRRDGQMLIVEPSLDPRFEHGDWASSQQQRLAC
ncbi:hypothetical protein PG995_003686 [Apiospora arundinis]